MKYIYELHKVMVARNLILVYEGEFTQEITKSVLAMAERNMDTMKEDSTVKRKVFNIMVECLQNIVKHSDEINSHSVSELNNAIFMIGKQDDKYIVVSGNPIANDKIDMLRGKLEKINSLDKDGLKEHYKEVIKNGKGLSEKGGAGLGFIDMARKSGQKLQFDFEPVNEEISFFSLKTVILRTNTPD